MKFGRMSEHDKVNAQRYRAVKCGTAATLTLSEWKRTISDFHGFCAYCLLKPYDLLEHFIPVEIGGTHVKNCVPACND